MYTILYDYNKYNPYVYKKHLSCAKTFILFPHRFIRKQERKKI